MDDNKTILADKVRECYRLYFDDKDNAYIINYLIDHIVNLMGYSCGMIGTVKYKENKCIFTPIGMTNTGWTHELFEASSNGEMKFTMDNTNNNIFVKTLTSTEPLIYNDIASYYTEHKDYRPVDHPNLSCFIGCCFDIHNVKGYINFANKEYGFTDEDKEFIKLLVIYISPLLYFLMTNKNNNVIVKKYMVPDILYLSLQSIMSQVIIINKFNKVFFSMGDIKEVLNADIPIGDDILKHVPQISSHLDGKERTNVDIILLNGNAESYISIDINPVKYHGNIYHVLHFSNTYNKNEMISEHLDLSRKYISYINHEVRNPLHTISMAVDILLFKQQYDELLTSKIKHSVVIINKIIDGIYELNNLIAKNGKVHYDIFDARELMQYTNNSLITYGGNNKNINCDISNSVPDIIKTDTNKVKRIYESIMHLLIRYSNNPTITVLLSCPETNMLLLSMISDDVCLTRDDIINVFKPYHRLSTWTDTITDPRLISTRFEMPIAKRLVEILDGSIIAKDINKNNGKIGLHIDVFIPIIVLPVKTPTRTITNNISILIVDDNEDNAIVTKAMIETINETAIVMTAYSGSEAIDLVKINKYDVILMDINMTDINGIDTTKIIKVHNPNIPIVAITGNISFSSEVEMYKKAYMFSDIFVKPISEHDIRDILAGINLKN
jgi:CheY-like chemotaxis protein